MMTLATVLWMFSLVAMGFTRGTDIRMDNPAPTR